MAFSGVEKTRTPLFKVKKIVDLSLPLTPRTPVYPGDPAPRIKVFATIEEHGYNVAEISMGSHSGSHVDAPYHFLQSGHTIEKMDLRLFFGPAVIVGVTEKQPGEAITPDDMKGCREQIQPGSIVLFHTNWDKRIGREDFFNHPFVLPEVIADLIALGVRTFAIDAINIDPAGGTEFPVHRLAAANNCAMVENLAGVERIYGEDCYLSLFPICLAGADGAPCRAVAIVPEVF
jgi:Predicted metal-dependent hydrolase